MFLYKMKIAFSTRVPSTRRNFEILKIYFLFEFWYKKYKYLIIKV